MDYSILTVRTTNEQDGRLHPTLTRESTIALEPLDGEPLRVRASGLVVSERAGGKLGVHLRTRVEVDLLVSDARVAVACVDPGDAGSLAGARARLTRFAKRYSVNHAERESAMLVGQVRYSWLRCVGFKPRRGKGSQEEVRLGVVAKAPDGEARELFLDLALPHDVDAAELSKRIAARAARYQLTYDEIADAAQRHDSQLLAEGMSLQLPAPETFALYQLPGAPFVSAASAYPAVNPRPGRSVCE